MRVGSGKTGVSGIGAVYTRRALFGGRVDAVIDDDVRLVEDEVATWAPPEFPLALVVEDDDRSVEMATWAPGDLVVEVVTPFKVEVETPVVEHVTGTTWALVVVVVVEVVTPIEVEVETPVVEHVTPMSG